MDPPGLRHTKQVGVSHAVRRGGRAVSTLGSPQGLRVDLPVALAGTRYRGSGMALRKPTDSPGISAANLPMQGPPSGRTTLYGPPTGSVPRK
eukprot:scaffold7886_cov176-Amphora_coffeaeformis.AAC.3